MILPPYKEPSDEYTPDKDMHYSWHFHIVSYVMRQIFKNIDHIQFERNSRCGGQIDLTTGILRKICGF